MPLFYNTSIWISRKLPFIEKKPIAEEKQLERALPTTLLAPELFRYSKHMIHIVREKNSIEKDGFLNRNIDSLCLAIP